MQCSFAHYGVLTPDSSVSDLYQDIQQYYINVFHIYLLISSFHELKCLLQKHNKQLIQRAHKNAWEKSNMNTIFTVKQTHEKHTQKTPATSSNKLTKPLFPFVSMLQITIIFSLHKSIIYTSFSTTILSSIDS